jgi:hypothetical protein
VGYLEIIETTIFEIIEKGVFEIIEIRFLTLKRRV